jgi:hypothetical protein
MVLQTSMKDRRETAPVEPIAEDHMALSYPITPQVDPSTNPTTDLECSSVCSIAWTTPIVCNDVTDEDFEVEGTPSRPASAPPTFPDCQGLHLLPHQKICAFAYCDLERQNPSLYCEKHFCRASNCGRAIALRAPENNWETNFIPGPFICLDDSSSGKTGDVEHGQLQIVKKSSSKSSNEPRYCSVHVCSIPLCDRMRAPHGLYCTMHRCAKKECLSYKIHPIASFCALHTPPYSRPRTSNAYKGTGYIASGVQIDSSDTGSSVTRQKKME